MWCNCEQASTRPVYSKRLIRHQEPRRTLLGQRDRRGEMGVDALAIDRELRELLLHRLLLVEPGLPRIEQRGADHHIGELQDALHEGERRVAVQRRSDEGRRLGMAVEEHVLPGNQHVVEHDQRVDLVEPIGQRIIRRRRAPGKARAADEFEVGRAQIADEADRVIRQRGVSPIGDGRLDERLIGVRRGGLVFRAAHHDAGVGLLDDVQQHVRDPAPAAASIGRPSDRCCAET